MASSALEKLVSGTDLDAISASRAFDVIVVGAGASGGLAADLLTEAGRRVLVLDAGWRTPTWKAPLKRMTASALAAMATPAAVRMIPRSLLWKGQRAAQILASGRQPVQTRCYAWASLPEGFVDDLDHGYRTPPDAPFDWIRVHGLGGRMAVPLHGRQYLRFAPTDFHPPDGLSPPWPMTAQQLDPWYELVEDRLRLTGGADSSPHAPDSRLANRIASTPAEANLIGAITGRYPTYKPVLSRYAKPLPPLEAAAATGRLTVRTGALVRHLTLNADGRAAGVVFHDRRAGRIAAAHAPIVMLCASALESTRILMTTELERGRDPHAHPVLGRNLMDHASIKADGTGPRIDTGGPDVETGRCTYLPRFDLRSGQPSPGRGFGVRVYQSPAARGASFFVAAADAEMLPNPANRVRLTGETNAFGVPTLSIECRHGEHEKAMEPGMQDALRELAEICGAKLDAPIGSLARPGSTIHECGTARMGHDPKTSVLDPFNQWWEAPGVYVTDAACFPSQGVQNPTLTILAITARACDRIATAG